jgi:hypothetical protein
MMDKFKSVPLPIWIGLGLVLIVILLMNRSSGKNAQNPAPSTTAPVGPVTTATMGTQGAQSNAGTDQQLGNLSVITQGGFAQLAAQNQALASQIAGNMNGSGMTPAGSAVQQTQNTNAQSNATNGTTGQNAGSNPVPVTTTG